MTKVRVYIATTEGPAEVQRITAEDPNVKSVICLDCKAVALPISPGYDAFVRKPTGLLEAAFGHPAYRLDLSLPISAGLSWQLGVLVAHALFAAGRLAERNQSADRVIWLTGEVDRDREVLAVSHIGEKLRSSSALFRDLEDSGTPVTLFLPGDNGKDLEPSAAGRDPDVLPVGSADEVLRHLGLPPLRGAGGRAASLAASRDTGEERALAWSLVGFGLASALLMAAGWGSQVLAPADAGMRQDRSLPSRAGLSLAAVELRALEGDSCAAVTFGAADPQIVETALSPGERVGTRAGARLCRLQYKITNGAAPARVWVLGARAGKTAPRLHTRTLTRAHELEGAESLSIDVRLPRHLETELFHRLAVITSLEAEERAAERLENISGALGPSRSVEEWEALLRDLRQSGLKVIDATHVLSP
ncbi:MAG: hypothetical protein QNJ30_06625 [Kiloniellales bacterium]|nr:hypothetical protein [Kiloniellales bacterium]